MSKAFVICGFSGIGKSTAEKRGNRIIDLESSLFSRSMENNKERDPDFPANYIGYLEKIIGDYQYYLLSCHKEVRDELKRRGINYIIVLPTVDQKNEYLKRWLKRGSPIEFIKSMNDRWEDMIASCEEDDAPKIYLSSDEYISDLICNKEGEM